ncbi:MAG: hypothetical protein WD801_00070 [Gemmatimonadaceae bacterium]
MKRSVPPIQWAYVYQLLAPVSEETLTKVSALLVAENSQARRRRASWTARLVIEDGHARILIVCESPAQDRKVNVRLETGLRRLGTEFSVTVPMALEGDITPIMHRRHAPD